MLTKKDAATEAFDAKGTIETVKKEDGSDLKIYLVKPSSETSTQNITLIVFQDIYSVRLFSTKSQSWGRIPAICDALAESLGVNVVLPDLFGDDAFDIALHGPQDEENWTTQNIFGVDGGPAWMGKNTYALHRGTVVATTKFVSETCGGTTIGAVGFCFGVWLMTKALVEGDTPFQAMVGCHPATILESAMHGGSEVELLEKASSKAAPMLFLCAGNDSDVFHDDKPGKLALETSGGGVSAYPDMVHGWVARGDTTSDDKVQRDVEKAMSEMADFFKTKLLAK